jgi:hypothetical protein
MKNLGRKYFLVALPLLLIGMVQGFWMGVTNALQYRDLHIALLLPGFVTLRSMAPSTVCGRNSRRRDWPRPNSGWQRLACCS